MTSDQFAYWLQGFSELNAGPPTPEQWVLIQEHLSLVFKKVTPQLGQVIYAPNKLCRGIGEPTPALPNAIC